MINYLPRFYYTNIYQRKRLLDKINLQMVQQLREVKNMSYKNPHNYRLLLLMSIQQTVIEPAKLHNNKVAKTTYIMINMINE